VIFLPLRRNPIMMRKNPKNPNQLSVERENADDVSWAVVSVLISIPHSLDTELPVTSGDGVGMTSSMSISDTKSIVAPIHVMTHFQIHFLTIPGSRSPRMSHMTGKR
jgi:hypothetical protein